jgi:triosephosphate isomerase (TIM)
VPTLTAPFFEIGPKNLMRKTELLALARSAEAALAEHGVTTILTVPVALIYLVKTAHPRLLVFAQTMSTEIPGPSVGAVIAESLVDASADDVMLNHASCPREFAELSAAVDRASGNGLQTIVCAGDLGQAISIARLRPTVVLFEPPELIGHAGGASRPWIAEANHRLKEINPDTLVMHAGGVVTLADVSRVMEGGASGTGATSGVVRAPDPSEKARRFIAAVRREWDLQQAAFRRSAATGESDDPQRR